MWRFVLFYLTLFSVSSLLEAQQLYKKGYLLRTPLDTIYGEIKYLSYHKAAEQVIFRSSPNSDNKVYAPKDLYGYGISDYLHFVSKSDVDGEKFLELIYQGSLSLYTYRDEHSRNYFYLENPTTGNFAELEEKVLRRNRLKKAIPTFHGVLEAMLVKNYLVAAEIKNTHLTGKSLTKLLMTYDERLNRSIGRVYQSKPPLWPPQKGIFLISGNARQSLINHVNASNALLWGAGIKFQKEISRATGRLFLDLDLQFTYARFDEVFEKREFISNNSVIFNGLNIFLPPGSTSIRGTLDYRTEVGLSRYNLGAPIRLKYIFPGQTLLLATHLGFFPQFTIDKAGFVRGQLIQNETVLLDVQNDEDTNRIRMSFDVGFSIYLKKSRTYFLGLNFSPSWLDQGELKYTYAQLQLGMLLEKAGR